MQGFYDQLKRSSNPAHDLRKEQVIESFLAFMVKKDKGKDRAYYENLYEESKSAGIDASSFEDYIYKYELHFFTNLWMEYQQWKSNFEKNIRSLETMKRQCIENQNTENRTMRNKYKLLEERIDKEIEEQKSHLRPEKLIEKVIGHALLPSYMSYWKNDLLRQVVTPFRLLTNWHDYMMFGCLPLPLLERLQKLRKVDHATYLEEFRQVVEQCRYPEVILETIRNNLILKDREEIFSDGLRLFQEKRYQSFVYLMVSQLEGLFHLYISGKGIDDHQANGMRKRADILEAEDKNFYEYVYFAFDIPNLRNRIAHGEIIQVTEEKALEILADLHWLVERVTDEKLPVMVWRNFLEGFQTEEHARRETVDMLFSGNLYSHAILSTLPRYLDGKFDEMIRKFSLEHKNEIFKKCLLGMELYRELWGKTEDAEPYSVHHNCEEFLEIMKEHMDLLPPEWEGEYQAYLQKLEQMKEQRRKRLDDLIKDLNHRAVE